MLVQMEAVAHHSLLQAGAGDHTNVVRMGVRDSVEHLHAGEFREINIEENDVGPAGLAGLRQEEVDGLFTIGEDLYFEAQGYFAQRDLHPVDVGCVIVHDHNLQRAIHERWMRRGGRLVHKSEAGRGMPLY